MTLADSEGTPLNRPLPHLLQVETNWSTTLLWDRGNTKRIMGTRLWTNKRFAIVWFGTLDPWWDTPPWRKTVKVFTLRPPKKCSCSQHLRLSSWSQWLSVISTLGKLTPSMTNRWRKLRLIMSMTSTLLSTEKLYTIYSGGSISVAMLSLRLRFASGSNKFAILSSVSLRVFSGLAET